MNPAEPPQIRVEYPAESGESVASVASVASRRTHTAKSRSVSSNSSVQAQAQTQAQAQGQTQTPAQGTVPKKTVMANFKVEAEIVHTDSSKSVSLFDYAEPSPHAGAAGSAAEHTGGSTTDTGSGHHAPAQGDAHTNSDSEETFVYDTQKRADGADDAAAAADGDRPILVHKNSLRAPFNTNNNSPAPRAFSQTVLTDNESVSSKKLVSQRRIPTLQSAVSLQQMPQQTQRFVPHRTAHYQASVSSKTAPRSTAHHVMLPAHVTAPRGAHGAPQLDDSDQESFISGDFARSETDGTHAGSSDSGDIDKDDTNTTLKQIKSQSDTYLLLHDKGKPRSPAKDLQAHHTRHLIVSQVRNVSKNLFENERNYLKKKLSFYSLKEDDEASYILRGKAPQGSDDGFPYYYDSINRSGRADGMANGIANGIANGVSNGMANGLGSRGNGTSRYYHHGTPPDGSRADFHGPGPWDAGDYDGSGFHRHRSNNSDFYQYTSGYDGVNPHDYVSKYKRRNGTLKVLSVLLKWVVACLVLFTATKIFIVRFVTNPVMDFEIAKIEKLIIAENLLIFDVDCVSANINLQDVVVDTSDVDVFLMYTNDELVEKTLLLGSISQFFVPLKFSGLLNNEDVALGRILDTKYTRNLKQRSVGQMKLSGDFKDVDENIESIITRPFEMNVRGSFKYRLPFSSTLNLINVSGAYKRKAVIG